MRRLALLAVAVMALAGCGTDDDGGSATPTPSGSAAGPSRIVSLSPTATEMLFAIGAGKQVVAVDMLSNYPADAPKTDLDGFKPNAEAVARHNPDLVVLSFDANNIVDGLKRLNIPVYVGDAAKTLDDAYGQITELGRLTGHQTEAKDVVDRMKGDIEKLTKDLPQRAKKLTYYYELDSQLNVATSKSFIGAVLGLAGLVNIADKADPQGTGYAQISPEFLFSANPDLIFLADTKCCAQNAGTVSKRPGWQRLTAVQQRRIVELDDDIASRWGPRVVDLLRVVADAVAKVPTS